MTTETEVAASSIPSELVQCVNLATNELLDRINNNNGMLEGNYKDTVCPRDAVRNYLSSCYHFDGAGQPDGIRNGIQTDFDSECEWINEGITPNLERDASTKIIIFEFFTHCCINCIHSIEELRQVLETVNASNENGSTASDKRLCEIKLVSIHSPKFTREKNLSSIKDFVRRMKMSHSDVVNDPNCSLWSSLGISCWPTILIFGPNPINTEHKLNLLYALMGEGHGKDLRFLLEESLKYFNETFDFSSIHKLEPETLLSAQSLTVKFASDTVDSAEGAGTEISILKYPGKVVFNGGRLVISDSGNNRIIISTTSGAIQDVVGGTERGFADGDFSTARFYNTQGIACQNEHVLFVADTGNHAIRRIDLEKKNVTTLVSPNTTTAGENSLISLKSPWDLCFYGSELLLIAAAGNHQIFGYFFQSLQLFRANHAANSFDLIAGTGKEENRNNMYILKSSFAQPSGIAVAHGQDEKDKVIYIADSESSSIRSIDATGRVMALVGGNRDPCDLFTYGDQDGCAFDVKLQHPVGICTSPGTPNVFIADTFNNKVKSIEVETKHCRTLFDGTLASFNEPGGIAVDDNNSVLYIADTNNHCIKSANLVTQEISQLDLKLGILGNSRALLFNRDEEYDKVFTCDIPKSANSREISFIIIIHALPETFEGGEWKMTSFKCSSCLKTTGEIIKTADESIGSICIEHVLPESMDSDSEFTVQVHIYFCASSSCKRRTLRFRFIIHPSLIVEPGISTTQVTLNYYPDVATFKV